MTLALASSIVATLLFCGLLAYRSRARALARELQKRKRRDLVVGFSEWWARNAAEMTPLEPEARAFMRRVAYAFLLDDDLLRFVRELDSIAADVERPKCERDVARSFVQELRAEHLPWELIDAAGKARHAKGRLHEEVTWLLHYGGADYPLDDPRRDESNSRRIAETDGGAADS